MNEKHVKALLTGLGIPAATIAELDKDDFDHKPVIASFNESQKAHYTDIIKNEVRPEIEAEVTKEVEGKLYSTLRNDIKKNFGVPADKLKDLFPHDMLKVAKSHMDETYSKNPNADQIKELQEKAMGWENKYIDYEQKFNAEVEKVRNEERQKTVSKLADIELQKKFNSIPAEKLAAKTHAPGYYLAMKSDLTSRYDFGLDEKENPVPFEKGTSKRATAKDASGKEYFVTVDELALTSLDTLGFLSKSNGGEGSGNAGRGGSGNGITQEKTPHMISLEQRAKKAAEAA